MRALLLALGLAACSSNQAPDENTGVGSEGCRSDRDCMSGEQCLQALCVATGNQPSDDASGTAHLAARASLDFGSVSAGATRRLFASLTNDGTKVVVLGGARIEPADAPFRLEPMGSGPFWIRPGRSRDVFVSFTPEENGHAQAKLVLESQAPRVEIALSGN